MVSPPVKSIMRSLKLVDSLRTGVQTMLYLAYFIADRYIRLVHPAISVISYNHFADSFSHVSCFCNKPLK